MASLAPQPLQQQQRHPTPSQTETVAPPTVEQNQTQPHPVLRLRGAHAPTRRTVQWRSDVVDNEGLGRKKSKVCCIYHRPRGVDESSDDSSSSDSSDSDSDSNSDSEPSADGRRGKQPGDGHHHGDKDGEDACDGHHHHHHHHGRGRGEGKSRRKRRPSPNAYEKMPRYDKPAKDGTGRDERGQGDLQGPQGA